VGLELTDKLRENLKRRLEKHTVKNGDHWIWVGSTSHGGHGKMTIDHKQYETSRVAAALFLGLDINSHIQLACHKVECGKKECWNPDHLYIGTKWSNMNDFIAVNNGDDPRRKRGGK